MVEGIVMRKSIFFTIIFIVVFFFSLAAQISAQTWSPNKRLTWNPQYSLRPSIAVDSANRIHVVWADSKSGNYQIYYKQSSDGGATWSAFQQLASNTGGSDNPFIAVDSANGIHVTWEDYDYASLMNSEIFYKRSTDSGATWSRNKRLTWNSGYSQVPSMAVDSGGGIHLVWEDYSPGNGDIYYKQSTDGGTTWSKATRFTWNASNSTAPSIAADTGGIIHVAWGDTTPGASEIFYKRSTDSGTTWSGIKRITWSTDWSASPSISVDSSSGVHLVWARSPSPDMEIYYKKSTDAGASWTGTKRMTWNSSNSFNASITADSGTGIHVVWNDYSFGNAEIFYKQSTDSGANWSTLTRLTWNASSSTNPAIAAAPGSSDIHVVWNDSGPGNEEIYYKNRK